MRVFAIVLGLLAAGSGLTALFRGSLPFRVPLTADDAFHAAIVFAIAAAVALLAGERSS